MVRTLHFDDFDRAELARRKGSTRVSVCLPAHDEGDTVGDIVATILDDLGGPGAERLVDEVVVVDDHSVDATRSVAEKAGARVVATGEVLAELGDRRGKGEALWKSVAACHGDLIVWVDADISGFDTAFVTGLLGPLLSDPSVVFTKGFYERPVEGSLVGGGRVTELVARPLLSLYFPQLTDVVQPLSGEFAARREVVEVLPFAGGYGVDLALLVDVTDHWGLDRVVQVDLGSRVHRNRPIEQLAAQSLEVLHAALRRAGEDPPEVAALQHPHHPDAEVQIHDRPALVEVPAYRNARLATSGS